MLSFSDEKKVSQTGRVWYFFKADEQEVKFLQKKYGVSEIAARLALHRMSSLEEADEIFSPFIKHHLPDPTLLPDHEVAFSCIYESLKKNHRLAVWGDYDVDGACSSALMVRYFQSLCCDIVAYIPDRFQEGYGPNQKGLQSLQEKGCQTIFIVDCGTTAYDQLAWAKAAGLNVIVIDHHRVGTVHPACTAFVNPKREDFQGPESLRTLCAGGLVFLFLVGLNRYLKEQGFFHSKEAPNLLSMLDLVALSTICDMMPLRGINRSFVKQGLKIMGQRKNLGLTALMDASGIREFPTPVHLGYSVGPKINAGGRIGDSSLGVRLLSSNNPEEATTLANELTVLNQERQYIERKVEEEAHIQALSQKNNPFLLVYGQDWHEGVLGIIASHLKEAYYKPTFVLAVKNGLLKGSVRSVPGVDVGDLIHQASEEKLLVTGGGHPMAGGLTLEQDRLEEFVAFIENFCHHNKPEEDLPAIALDMCLSFQWLKNSSFFEALEQVGPFGAGYAAPRFLFRSIRLENVMTFGYNHLRMRGVQLDGRSHSIVFFRSSDKPAGQFLLSKTSYIGDCVFNIQIDRRWGYSRAHLVLEDFW